MGSLQFTEQDLVRFRAGPTWCRLQHVKTGEILLVMKRIAGVEEELEWSHLDEASRPLHFVGEGACNACRTVERIVERTLHGCKKASLSLLDN